MSLPKQQRRPLTSENIQDARPIGLLKGHAGAVECVRWNPDGRYLATKSAGSTIVWDATGTKHSQKPALHQLFAAMLAGKAAGTTKADEEIKTRNQPGQECKTYSIVATIPSSLVYHRGLCWSSEGDALAFISPRDEVCLWSLHSRTITATLKGPSPVDPRSLAWSPDNKLLAAGNRDHTVHLWNVQSQELVSILRGHSDWVQTVAFRPDGSQLCSTGGDGKLRVWNMATEAVAATLEDKFRRWVAGAAWSPDGTLLSAVQGDSVLLWNVSARTVLARLPRTGLTSIEPVGVGFSPDGRLLAVPCGELVRVFDVASRTVAAELVGHAGAVRWAEFSADGALLASASEDGTARVWGLAAAR